MNRSLTLVGLLKRQLLRQRDASRNGCPQRDSLHHEPKHERAHSEEPWYTIKQRLNPSMTKAWLSQKFFENTGSVVGDTCPHMRHYYHFESISSHLLCKKPCYVLSYAIRVMVHNSLHEA